MGLRVIKNSQQCKYASPVAETHRHKEIFYVAERLALEWFGHLTSIIAWAHVKIRSTSAEDPERSGRSSCQTARPGRRKQRQQGVGRTQRGHAHMAGDGRANHGAKVSGDSARAAQHGAVAGLGANASDPDSTAAQCTLLTSRPCRLQHLLAPSENVRSGFYASDSELDSELE